eukprot:gene703-762_t
MKSSALSSSSFTSNNNNLNQTLQPEQKKLRVLIHSLCKIDDGTLLADVDLRKYASESGQAITNSTVQELCSIHPRINSLNLSNCSQVTDVGLWALAKHCPGITKLILYGCGKISHVGIRSISLKCNHLVELDLSHCALIDDMALTVLAGGSWKIHRLSLQYCHPITDTGVARIAIGMNSHLQYLNLTGCPNIGEFGDRALKELGLNCPNLEELYLDDTKRVEDTGCITLAQGCHFLRILHLAGCENLTKRTLRAFAEGFTCLQELKLIWNRKLHDFDYSVWSEHDDIPLRKTLTTLELHSFDSLSDKGIGAICKAIGSVLTRLTLVSCQQLSDYSAMIISHLCPKLRSLDLSYCGHFTNEAIHHLAQRLSRLTSLKLDGNNKITNSCLLKYIDRELEFVEMANQWIGYQPKARVEELIAKREQFILQTSHAIKIQSMIRKRFAHRVFWERYRERLLAQAIPLFQAHVRGYFQRKRYSVIQQQLHRIRMATKIQSKWRNYSALHDRIRKIKRLKWEKRCNEMALTIQRVWRGHCDRKVVNKIRTKQANERMEKGRKQALKEIAAAIIQRIFRGHSARIRVYAMQQEREAQRKRQLLEMRCMRFIQRVARGKLGRIRAQQRRDEIALWHRRWNAALQIERVYRGHLGRLRFKHFLQLEILRRKNQAATHIQRHYRGYRGRLLAAVARALKELRFKHQFFALEIQRFLRGCMGRHYFKLHREEVTKHRKQVIASIVIQRVYRGHKGREAREIESELRSMEHKAKPLFDHLKQLEDEAQTLRHQIHRLESIEKMMSENISEITRELEHCVKTTSKYTDSARINGVPQRFLTKFLKVRLADHLEHEEEVYKQKYLELQTKRADLRDMEKEILLAQRELIPLTTGLISEVKRRRYQVLRDRVKRKQTAAIVIQAVWRRALVRSALYDDYKEYWIKRIDREQSDKPYYYNVMSNQSTWTMPLAYRYFGDQVDDPDA